MQAQAKLVLLPEAERTELVEFARIAGARRILSCDGSGWRVDDVLDADVIPHDHQQLGLFTSGTTGRPKLNWHSWKQVARQTRVKAEGLVGVRWLMTYAPRSFAAIQVLLASVLNKGTVCYAPAALAELATLLSSCGIDVVSATPSWWRRLLIGWPREIAKPTIRQITMGGEPVAQDILDAVREAFRPSRLTHVYASTEAGSVFSVSDGRAGFPAEWLESERRSSIRVRGGQLEVRVDDLDSRGDAASAGRTGDGWYRTPDLAEIVNGRVLILGRADDTINVGGRKFTPEQIESIVRTLPQVGDCRAYAKRSPITGFVVALEVVARGSESIDIPTLKSSLAVLLPRELVPRLITIVPAITMTAAGKRSRFSA